MRRASPYPCSGPITSSVRSTISASVPCHTSVLPPIEVSYGNPIETPYVLSYGITIGVFLRFLKSRQALEHEWAVLRFSLPEVPAHAPVHGMVCFHRAGYHAARKPGSAPDGGFNPAATPIAYRDLQTPSPQPRALAPRRKDLRLPCGRIA